MPKVSISLPDDVLDFIDKQGVNRSKTITEILLKFKNEKFKEQLAKAYEDYEEFCREDEKDWWPDWEKSALKDMGSES